MEADLVFFDEITSVHSSHSIPLQATMGALQPAQTESFGMVFSVQSPATLDMCEVEVEVGRV